MAQQESIEDIKTSHPVDNELFGAMGAVAAHLCGHLSNAFVGKQFEFMDMGEYQAIADSGRLSEVNRIYWRETLFRIYWAAALNLARHQRWQAGCVRAYTTSGGLVRIKTPDDASHIRELCNKYRNTISDVLSLSVTTSALCLKALNWFSLQEVKCAEVECWNFDDVPGWRKAEAAALSNIVN